MQNPGTRWNKKSESHNKIVSTGWGPPRFFVFCFCIVYCSENRHKINKIYIAPYGEFFLLFNLSSLKLKSGELHFFSFFFLPFKTFGMVFRFVTQEAIYHVRTEIRQSSECYTI